jgi:acetyltransferase
MFRSVETLLKPRSIAIVGASESGGGGWAKSIYNNLAYAGFPAKTFLINPKRTELWGEKVYPDFASLGDRVDLALIIIPSEGVPAVLSEGAANGLRCALIFASRFGEGGDEEGARRGAEIKAISEQSGLRLSGPNCMGAISIQDRFWIYPSAKIRTLPTGSVGVVFQSGGTFQFWLHQGALRGLGYTYAISSGNEIDLDLADYINFMVDDERTKLICCMVEGVRRPHAFLAAAEKALQTNKPILMVKVGSSAAGQAAARSHTGALAGDDRVFNAVCEKFGVIRCHSLDDMIETALAFSQGQLPRGPRAAMVIASGGAKGLFLDYAHEEGVEFGRITPATTAALAERIDPGVPAENPLDVGTGLAVRFDRFTEVCSIMADDPNVDILAVHAVVPIEEKDLHDTAAFARLRGSTSKPIIGFGRLSQNTSEVGRDFQTKSGIPFLQGMPQTVRAIKRLADYATVMERGIASMPSPRGKAEHVLAGNLERELVKYDLVLPRSAVAPTLSEVEATAAEVGFPVVLKIVSPQAIHKSEVGGVAVNLPNAGAVRAAAEGMTTRLMSHDPSATVTGYIVQEMVQGVEFLIGVREDPQYGPIMVAGLGGVFVEALQDINIWLLPVDEKIAADMLASLAGRALLEEFRGRSARDCEALVKAMAGLSRFFLDHRTWLSDLEINPLMVLGQGAGVRAVDIRAIRRSA